LQVLDRFPEAVDEMFATGEWYQDQFPDNPALTKGMTQDYMGPLKAFLPGELRSILESDGMQVLRCGGLGTLAGYIPQKYIEQACQSEILFEEFLNLCERYDQEILPDGAGTRERAGLIAIAQPR
jgi:hypothetical protein